MQYKIPIQNIEKLTKKINRIINKGAPIKFEILEECQIPVKLLDDNKSIFYIKGKVVEVEGNYVINGWRFVATLEHRDNGNIIRCVDSSFEGRIPEYYRTCTPQCDHCKQFRHRKDTYLIYNDKTNEFKQVGKSCLMEFTNGLDAEVCANICQGFSFVEECERIDDFNTLSSNSRCVENALVKTISYQYVKENGYISKDTSRKIIEILETPYQVKVSNSMLEELKKIDSWLESQDLTNDYMHNAKIAWNSRYCEYRDIALIASLINTYLKSEGNKTPILNQYFGDINQTVIFEVAKKRTIYCKGKYSYYGEYVYVYELIDTEGHVIIWSTSSVINVGDIIQAKVKSFNEYKGTKQTTITRGKIINHASTNSMNMCGNEEETRETSQSKKALDNFISLLEN